MNSKFFISLSFFLALNSVSFAQDVTKLMEQAQEARRNMDVEEAVVLYTKVLEIDSMNVDAYYNRGWSKAMFNRTQGIEDFLKVIELDSLHEGAYHGAAEYYNFIGDDEKADYYEQKAIILNPNDPNNLLLQTRNESEKGNYEKALELCNRSISLQDEGGIWLSVLERAEIYYKMGKYLEATVDFEKCFNEYTFGMYSSWNFEVCGDAYEKMGQITKACEMWNLAITHPDVEEPSETAKKKLKKKCKK